MRQESDDGRPSSSALGDLLSLITRALVIVALAGSTACSEQPEPERSAPIPDHEAVAGGQGSTAEPRPIPSTDEEAEQGSLD